MRARARAIYRSSHARVKMLITVSALAVGGFAGTAGAAPAPKLDFTPAQMQLAYEVAPDAGLAAFYGSRDLRPIFTDPSDGSRYRRALIDAVDQAPRHGLPPARYHADRLSAADAQPTGDQDELLFAQSLSAWAHDLGGGLITPSKVDPMIKREVHRRPLSDVLADFAASADPAGVLAALAPKDPRYAQLMAALAQSGGGAAPSAGPKVPAVRFRPGDRGPSVSALRERLVNAGFQAGSGSAYDDSLMSAVAEYQARAGLDVDGIAGGRTIQHLNGGANTAQARAIMMSLERMRWLAGHDLNTRMVWVNLPSYTAQIMDGGAEVFSTKVVVGKATDDFATPEFSDQMEYLVVNPRWNVPRSITIKEYLPRLKANPNAVSFLDVVDGRGRVIPRSQIDFSKYTAANFPYRMQQKPSDDNALGVVKFIFPNPWNIYLHDTPSKGLFNESRRAYSHGCIRIGRPIDLAHELLRPQTSDPDAMFSRALKSGKETWLHLEPEIPVHLVYFTLLPDADGKMRSYADIYGRDTRLWAAMAKAGLASPAAGE
ncbi:MAG: peptidoglycan-binding protein [Paracoccus denitrificans]|nr:MAG: peptidoglycan-binding protein [Paracoccus denitrificans]PZO84585.1 MAG: peptidoglycan-binding protein [Paracoccus denitrificans]